MTPDTTTYTLRTLAITEHKWLVMTSTTMEDDTITSVTEARSENLKAVHRMLADDPGIRPATWREPTADMKVTVNDSIIRHDLVTGKALEERELAPYTLPYEVMNP